MSIGVRGEFELSVVKADSGVVVRKVNFPNLITDIGLENWARGWSSPYCQVGTGASTPAATDTSLVQGIAQTQMGLASGSAGTPPDYAVTQRYTCRFDAGTISNNISEIGVRMGAGGSVWCRQRILDEYGEPSSITVLSNEYLDVAYTVYFYPNLQDNVFTFAMDGVTYSCVSRHARGAQLASNANTRTYITNYCQHTILSVFSTQQLGDITGEPGGTAVTGGAIGVLAPYDYSRRFSRSDVVKLELAVYNVDGGIGSMLVADYFGLFYRQLSFNPKLPKDQNTVMELQFSDTISRHSI